MIGPIDNAYRRATCRAASALALLLSATALASAGSEDDLQALLDAAGWPTSRLQQLAAQDVLTLAEEQDLVKLAERLQRYERLIAAAAEEGAGLAKTIRGDVIHTERVTLGDDRQLGKQFYFRCHIESSDALPQKVFALQAPQAWLDIASLRQPVEATGLALGPYFITSRIRWLPQAPLEGAVNFGESLLGGMGFDVGLLDSAADGAPILPQERDLFYELLAVMQETGANQLVRFAQGNLPRWAESWHTRGEGGRLAKTVISRADEGRYSVAPLFNDAVAQRGELFVFDGLVRRAVRVEVAAGGDRHPAERFGFEHYYELELFTEDSQNLPLVFCVLELPEGFPTGDVIAQEARIAGFFLKRWAYRTRKSAAGPRAHDKGQLAPLLFGRAPIPLAPAEKDHTQASLAAGIGFTIFLLATCLMVWRFHRSDREFDRNIRQRFSESVAPGDFEKLSNNLDGG